jgi:hypothetical protein
VSNVGCTFTKKRLKREEKKMKKIIHRSIQIGLNELGFESFGEFVQYVISTGDIPAKASKLNIFVEQLKEQGYTLVQFDEANVFSKKVIRLEKERVVELPCPIPACDTSLGLGYFVYTSDKVVAEEALLPAREEGTVNELRPMWAISGSSEEDVIVVVYPFCINKDAKKGWYLQTKVDPASLK